MPTWHEHMRARCTYLILLIAISQLFFIYQLHKGLVKDHTNDNTRAIKLDELAVNITLIQPKEQQPKEQQPKEQPVIHAVVLFRLWPGDTFGMGVPQLVHWVSYMKEVVGIDKIHLYDNCQSESECVNASYNASRWPEADYFQAQYTAYQHCMASIGSPQNTWMIQLDLDEFPFMPWDSNSGFLKRYINQLSTDTTQVLLPCMFFGGQPENEDPKIPVRYTHRQETTEQTRTKPLFRLDSAQSMQFREVHVHGMRIGNTIKADPAILRFNHYWGDRINQGPVIDTSLQITMPRIAAYYQIDGKQPAATVEVLRRFRAVYSRAFLYVHCDGCDVGQRYGTQLYSQSMHAGPPDPGLFFNTFTTAHSFVKRIMKTAEMAEFVLLLEDDVWILGDIDLNTLRYVINGDCLAAFSGGLASIVQGPYAACGGNLLRSSFLRNQMPNWEHDLQVLFDTQSILASDQILSALVILAHGTIGSFPGFGIGDIWNKQDEEVTLQRMAGKTVVHKMKSRYMP